jgi:transglutaminase-like putative cysteine protease
VRTNKYLPIIISLLLISATVLIAVTPRCELGTYAIYHMTHWVAFASVPSTYPVTVTMLINAETRPYLDLLEMNYSPQPTEIREVTIHFHPGDAGQRGLLITWTVEKPTTVTADFKVAIYQSRYVSNPLGADNSKVEGFLEATPLYPAEDPLVKKIAASILDNVWWKSNTEKARAIYNWVRANLNYDVNMVGVYDAVRVLKERRGVCEGFAYTFATLCRAMGVPSRVFYGRIIGSPAQGVFWTKHSWAEFWDGSNWEPVDPTLGSFGTLNIHPYVHMSFDVWAISVRTRHGEVWPVNTDGRVMVRGVGLDWGKFSGYGYTTWTISWTVIENIWIAIPVSIAGTFYRLSRRQTRTQTLCKKAGINLEPQGNK